MRLIDADALIESIEQSKGKNAIYAQFVRAYTKGAPTVDAVPVVRCKDCFLYGECKAAKWYGENGNGYCSVGDRSKDNE